MAKPKPPEESEAILIRLPKSLANRLRELAAASRSAKGYAMSANQLCVAVLTNFTETGIPIQERIRYDMITPIEPAKAAEPSADETPRGKGKRHGT